MTKFEIAISTLGHSFSCDYNLLLARASASKPECERARSTRVRRRAARLRADNHAKMLTGRWGPAEVYRTYRAHTERIRKNAQALRQRERSHAMRQRFQRAVRRLILVNRLIGHGVPGGGGVLEEARKRGEQRQPEALMRARRLLDVSSEDLVEHAAKMEEERDEARAGLFNELFNTGREWRKVKRQYAEQQQKMQRVVQNCEQVTRDAKLWKERLDYVTNVTRRRTQLLTKKHREKCTEICKEFEAVIKMLAAEIRRDEEQVFPHVEFLNRQNRELHGLTQMLVHAHTSHAAAEHGTENGTKRARTSAT